MPRSIWPLVACRALALAGSPAAADDALDAAKADMAATLGPDSVQTGVFPDAFSASTWAQTRAWLIDNDATIPPKYRALIGLAVSSQIPCEYCIYADTADARVFGATDEEIKEAIMFAGADPAGQHADERQHGRQGKLQGRDRRRRRRDARGAEGQGGGHAVVWGPGRWTPAAARAKAPVLKRVARAVG